MAAINIINFVMLFVYCVKSSDITDEPSEKVSVVLKPSRYNNFYRPPSVEAFNIPVVVVVDEGNRKDKSIDVNVSKSKANNKSIDESFTETITTTNSVENQTIILVTNSEEPSDNKPKNDTVKLKDVTIPIVTKSSTQSITATSEKPVSTAGVELQIPVVVVYDAIPEVVVDNKKTSKRRRLSKKIENSNNDPQSIQPASVTENQNHIVANKSRRLREKIQVPIVQSENFVYSHNGEFHYSYEGGDGTKAFERGKLKSIDENTGESVVGGFSYTGKDGNDYSLSYTADENGYRPVGAHLPTPPPIPPAIARALKYLATKTTPEPVTEPSK